MEVDQTNEKNSNEQATIEGGANGKVGSEGEKKKEQDNAQPNNQELQEKQEKVKSIIIKLFKQIKDGCQKDLCFSKYCKNNPLQAKKLHFANQKEILQEVLKIIQEEFSKSDSLIDSDSVSWNKDTLETVQESQLKDLLEDAYSFASSFSFKQKKALEQLETSSPSKEEDIEMLPTELQAERNPVTDFKIDFESLDKYIKLLTKSFENESELIKVLEQQVQLLNMQFSESHKSVDSAFMVWRATIMLLQFEQFFDFQWKPLLESIIANMALVIKAYPKDHIFIDFIRFTIPKAKFMSLIQKLQSNITIGIISGIFDTDSISKCITVIDIFNDANNQRDLKEKIDYREFYNDAINSDVRLVDHIIVWKKETEKCKKNNVPVDKSKIFSLCFYPWILNASSKSDLLKVDNKIQQESSMVNDERNLINVLLSGQNPFNSLYLLLKINRSNVVEDTLRQIQDPDINKSFKKPLRIEFVGEPGIDEGGVKKEFFQILLRDLFDPDYGMFFYNQELRLYWFNGFSHEMNINYELIGLLMGLAIYNNIILAVNFPLVCYKKLLFMKPTFDDLRQWQPQVAKSLEYILNYSGDEPLESALATTFTINVELYGENTEQELKEGGSQILVTKENKEEYVELYIDFLFNKQCQSQMRSFQKGFYRVCDEELFTMFKPEELELLVCGSKSLDFTQLQQVTKYVDGYTKEHPIVGWFWDIIHSLSDDEKKQFLAFSTGSDRAPIDGLKAMKFYIGRMGEDSERLPSAHTCFNHLLIPEYSSKEKLRQKLLQAINNSEGFGLL